MLTPEKADSMRAALAFVRAVSKQQMGDAGIILRGLLEGDRHNDPAHNVANAMCVMATLLCQELDITDEWVDMRLTTINWIETHPDAYPGI